MLLLVCPNGQKYLWVGASFQIPDELDVPVSKKKAAEGAFDDLSDDGMDICGSLSGDDKSILKWAKCIDSSTVACKNVSELFNPESICIQR